MRSTRGLIEATVCAAFLVLAGSLALAAPESARAQSSPPLDGEVQLITGRIESGQTRVYLIPDVKAGQTVYARMDTVSGNLDPTLAILAGDADILAVGEAYSAGIERLVASGQDIANGLNALRDELFLAWDDDSGGSYAAALAFPAPVDGDYRVIAAGSLSALGRATAGEFRLLVGIDAPEILAGDVTPNNSAVARQDESTIQLQMSAEEVTGTLTITSPVVSYRLVDLQPGDAVYASVTGAPGQSAPALLLRDFGGKPLDAANLDGQQSRAAVERRFPDGGANYTLEVAYPSAAMAAPAEFQLQVGINVSDALAGLAVPAGSPVIERPITVEVGLQLQQIVQVSQEDEYFTGVGNLRLDWTDPALAFNPETCRCSTKIYTEKEFDRFLSDVASRWPDFSFQNQQGNRWIQNRAVVLRSDGRASYFERFSTNFQVDFDFTRFPFDVQRFEMRVEMLYPDDRYVLADLPGYSEISPENGEDEFILDDFHTAITTAEGITGLPASRFTFWFEAPRHLTYYLLQVFVPIVLITIIAWVTFFLRDFTKRAEVAAANVLLFIAFSFSLSDNYPRLGYLTFLDAIMVATFIINTLVVVYNVYLKWLENKGRLDRAERIDRVMDWLYPTSYLAAMALIALAFV